MGALFFDSRENELSESSLLDILLRVGAADCETLFIHSDIMFGTLAKGVKPKELCSILYDVLLKLNVPNIIVPTFTYSFCNHEIYDVLKSKTSMGVFNEFIRKLVGRYRTLDPLLSLSVPGSLASQFKNVSEHSLGENSGLDILHSLPDVKFLFLGADMANCFTYVHYVEKMMDVPYRFDKTFEGEIIDVDGNTFQKSQTIHTQCSGVKLPKRYGQFEKHLLEKNLLKQEQFGDKFISCISEKDAYLEIEGCISSNRFYFVEEPYKLDDLVHEYTYDWTKMKITHC